MARITAIESVFWRPSGFIKIATALPILDGSTLHEGEDRSTGIAFVRLRHSSDAALFTRMGIGDMLVDARLLLAGWTAEERAMAHCRAMVRDGMVLELHGRLAGVER